MQKFIKFNIDTTYDDMRIIEKAIFKGDTLTLVIKVFDNGILADLTNQIVDLVLLKADGTVVEGVQKTISNGVITATLTQQATLCEGFVRGTLVITENSTSHISTNEFTYLVLPSIADTVLEESKAEIQTLSDLLLAIKNNTTVINNYTSLINQVFSTTSSVQALADIKAYIDSNLASLKSENTKASSNIPTIQSENIKATNNIAAMQAFGDIATLALTVQSHTKQLSDNAYLSKYKNIYNPIFLEQFFRTWYGRGQLTAEIPYETIAGTTTFTQGYNAFTNLVTVSDATYFLEGSVLAVEYDDGTHDTYFVFSKSGNTITLYPGLRKAVTTTTKIQRAWYNSAHANDFALKYIGEQLANAKYQNVISGEVIKEFNMNETNILQQFKKIGGATIATQSEINKGANYGTPLTSVSNQAISVIGYASGDGYRTIDIPVKPSSKVNINVWLRANNASNSVNIKTSTGILLGSINVRANNMYEPYDLSCNIPFNVNKIYIEFVVTATATVGIYIDDLVVSYREKEGYILPRKGNIVMLFDSWGNWFTTGIENSLKSLLPQANIINKSVGGNTATDMLNRFDTDVTPNNPDIVICDTGVNDAYGMTSDDTTTYLSNIKKIIDKCKEINAIPIFLGLPALAETDPRNTQFTQWQLTTRSRKMSFEVQKSMLKYQQYEPKQLNISIPQISLAQNAQSNVCIGVIPSGNIVKVKTSGLYSVSSNVKLQVGFSTSITDALLGTANSDDLATTNYYEKTTSTIDTPDFSLKNNSGSNRFLVIRILNTDTTSQTVSGFVSLEI